MYQTFLTFIEKKRLLRTGEKVLIGVSGGVDSMVLLDLLVEAGYEVGVGHVNYHLRGQNSDKDAQLVAALCQKKEIPFHGYDVSEEDYKKPGSIQMIAREVRYRFFEELAEAHGYDRIATAHHVNDNLETVLFNFTKGTGISGMIGIAPKKGKRIRPLLFADKAQIYRYAKDSGLTWREDESNAKSSYKRNLIRNKVIPLLQEINPALLDTFQDTLTRFQGVASLLDERKSSLLAAYKTSSGGIEEFETGWIEDNHLSQTLLFEFMKAYEMNFRQCVDLWDSIRNNSVGAVFSTPTYDINLDRGKLLIQKHQITSHVYQEIQRGEKEVQVGNSVLTLESGNDTNISINADIACLDEGKIRYPLIVRSWRQGDVFYPLGMTGKKKVSDFMIDSKIPVTLKEKVLVMESAGEIIWVVGLRIDDRYKVTSSTSRMLKITTGHA